MTTTPTKRAVRLKRVESLTFGDVIRPHLGLFTRAGVRLEAASGLESAPIEWTVVEPPELDSSGLLATGVLDEEEDAAATMWSPADAWVVLA